MQIIYAGAGTSQENNTGLQRKAIDPALESSGNSPTWRSSNYISSLVSWESRHHGNPFTKLLMGSLFYFAANQKVQDINTKPRNSTQMVSPAFPLESWSVLRHFQVFQKCVHKKICEWMNEWSNSTPLRDAPGPSNLFPTSETFESCVSPNESPTIDVTCLWWKGTGGKLEGTCFFEVGRDAAPLPLLRGMRPARNDPICLSRSKCKVHHSLPHTQGMSTKIVRSMGSVSGRRLWSRHLNIWNLESFPQACSRAKREFTVEVGSTSTVARVYEWGLGGARTILGFSSFIGLVSYFDTISGIICRRWYEGWSRPHCSNHAMHVRLVSSRAYSHTT